MTGRPRTTTPPDEELVKLGEELIKWATEPTDELRCRFAQWYSVVKGIRHVEWDLMLQKEIFRGYYEHAQTILGQKFIDGSVKEGIAHRFLRRYCPEIKHEENEKAAYETSLKREADKEVNKDYLEKHNAFNNQLNAMRKPPSQE